MIESPKKLKRLFSEEGPITITRKISESSMAGFNNSIFSFPSSLATRRFITCAYVFFFAFIICSSFFIFYTPTQNLKTVWLENIMHNGTQFSSIFSRFYYNGSHHQPQKSRKTNGFPLTKVNGGEDKIEKVNGGEDKVNESNSGGSLSNGLDSDGNFSTNSSGNLANGLNSDSGSLNGSNVNADPPSGLKSIENRDDKWLEKMIRCSVFHGRWVPDNEVPIYEHGSCPHIDQDFDCFLNGRSENAYEKYRWKPQDCDIPRWNGEEMLKLLQGKRLVYVGDSLNRNMWESMICMIRDSVQNKSNVFEASGNIALKKDGSYSFQFTDHNFSVEFFRTNFLVQESAIPIGNGSLKETLRLDLVEHQSEKYKDADILVFNTGHWWTHEKTQEGKDYYQEGSHVYKELNVFEALRKAMTTWSRWIDENVDMKKTLVLFRGYSASHFNGGKWNTGGTCDNETLPIYNEEYLQMQDFLPWLESLESAIYGMKTPVFYLNVTRMSDFRKDAHPSIYRKQNLTDEERRMRIQDCSHWCLPGVPDTWNEIVYSRILMRHIQMQQEENKKKLSH